MRWLDALAAHRRKTRTRRALINLMVHDGRSMRSARERMRCVGGVLAAKGYIVKLMDYECSLGVCREFFVGGERRRRAIRTPWWLFVIRGARLYKIIDRITSRLEKVN